METESEFYSYRPHAILRDFIELERRCLGLNKTDYLNYILAKHFARKGEQVCANLAVVFECAILNHLEVGDGENNS